MNKLIGLMAMLCVAFNSFGQDIKTIKSLYIDDAMPDISFGKVINCKDSTARFFELNKKLTILDFWNIHCTVCIAQFPKELALQKQFNKDIQIILVTSDSLDNTKRFIKNWETQHRQKFFLPIVVEDTTWHKYIRSFYQPNYAWFDYEPHLIAQTNEYFLNAGNIVHVLQETDTLKAILNANQTQ